MKIVLSPSMYEAARFDALDSDAFDKDESAGHIYLSEGHIVIKPGVSAEVVEDLIAALDAQKLSIGSLLR